MKNLIDTFQKYDLLRSIVLVFIGTLVLLKPAQFFNGVVYLLAGYIAFLGIMNLFVSMKNRQSDGVSGFGMTSGILFLLTALAFIVLAKPILSIVPFIIGILIFSQGFSHFFETPKGPRIVNRSQWPRKVFYALIMIAGLVIIFRPFKSMMILIGIIILLIGISGIVRRFLNNR